MNFSMVSNKRLKIVLDKGDMSCYKISFSTLDYSSKENKAVFTELISRAKKETGFDTDGYKLLIEAFPGSDGGAFIYITKLAARPLSVTKKTSETDGKYILEFSDINSFIDGARYIKSLGIKDVNFYEYSERFFAEVHLCELERKERKKTVLNMLEYAECIIDYKFMSYLNEYGVLLQKDGKAKP